MIRLSSAISKWLHTSGAIAANDINLYSYGIYTFLLSIFPVAAAVMVGLFVNMIPQSVVMILPFILLRKFSGGFHLKSSVACTISSFALLSLFLYMVYLINSNKYIYPTLTVTFLATLCIFLNSPIDSEERRLTPEETNAFKAITKVLVCLMFGLYLFLLYVIQTEWSTCLAAGITLTAVLQVPCIVRRLFKSFLLSHQ